MLFQVPLINDKSQNLFPSQSLCAGIRLPQVTKHDNLCTPPQGVSNAIPFEEIDAINYLQFENLGVSGNLANTLTNS